VKLALKDMPEPLRRCVREVEREFYREKVLRPAIRAWFPDSTRLSYTPVEQAMEPGRKWIIEEMLIVAGAIGSNVPLLAVGAMASRHEEEDNIVGLSR
jgi:hypothetical protein